MAARKKKKDLTTVYQIRYSYWTGDSFHTEDREDVLEYEWKDHEIALESLKRIEEHYQWYQGTERSYKTPTKKPKWHNVNNKWASQHHCLINLRMDDGKEVQFWPPWIGYFEGLHWTELEIKLDKHRMEF